MAETGKRSLPAHTMPLLIEMEKLSRQVTPAERDNEKKENRLSASLVYNRVNKTLRQRNAAGLSLLRAAAAGIVQKGDDNIAAGKTAGIEDDQITLHSIPGINKFNQLLSTQSIQKTALARQLQHRLRQREAAVVKVQELKVLLTYTDSMIVIEDKRMNSLCIPLLKKNAAIRQAKLQYKKMQLEKQLLRFSAPALLRSQFQINILERHVNELDQLLQTFESR